MLIIAYSIFRPTGSVTQVIDNIDTSKTYRIVFYYVKFDTPTANACTLTTTIGTQTILTEVNAAPRTPNNTFDQKITASFQPTDSSMPLTIGVICTSVTLNRSCIDDVSIEEVI